MTVSRRERNIQEDSLRVAAKLNKKKEIKKSMCISKADLEKKVQEIRRYKAMAEEAAEIQKSLEAEVITYMVENGLDTEITDTAKITYKSQTRSTLDKKRLEEDLGSLEEYTNVTEYNVLRIK